MTTLIDLYRKTLEELEVVAAGESANAEDTQVVADKYVGLFQMLLTMDLVGWGQTEDVPDYAVIPLTLMLAFVCAKAFGKDDGKYAASGALNLPQVSLAERQLRMLLARHYVSYPAASEYL